MFWWIFRTISLLRWSKRQRHGATLNLKILSTFLVLAILLLKECDCLLKNAQQYDELTSYCDATSGSESKSNTWICYFLANAAVSCAQGPQSSNALTISSIYDAQRLSSRIAYINVSNCSNEADRLPVNLLSQFENFVVGISATACPNVKILSSAIKRISHQARCLVLMNVSQELLENTENFDRLDSLKKIAIINSSVSSLTNASYSFIQSSSYLEQLTIRHTNLDAFDLEFRSYNQSLSRIDLSDNSLDHFSINSKSVLSKITYVNLANNRLHMTPRYLRFDHTTTVVDLSNCSLRSVENLHGQLHALNLSHNAIAEIRPETFDDLDSLTILDLSFNALTALPDLPFGAHLSLIELNLSHNKLTSIPDRTFGNSSLLISLDLSYNELETISSTALNFSKLSMLRYLNLENNRLKWFPSIEPYFDSFFISLDSNRLTALSVLPTKFNHRIVVSARNNSISDYHNVNVGMLDLITTIDHLGIWDPSLFPEWTKGSDNRRAIEIDISANKIKALDAHLVMASLVIRPHSHFHVSSFYNFSDNPLACSCEMLSPVRYLLEAYNMSVQHHIDFSIKQIRSMLDVRCVAAVPERRSQQNFPLRELGSDSFKKTFKCSDDKASCPDECFCFSDEKTDLNKADCAECDCLHDMPLIMPPETAIIDLSGNYIKVLSCRTYLSAVRKLYLSNNLLDSISDCVYEFLHKVEYIGLESNHLLKFPVQLAYVKSLQMNESVNLVNNSFSCECSDAVRHAFQAFGSRLVYPEAIECIQDDGTAHIYLDFLDFCSTSENSRTLAPSGVQMVLLVIMSAIVAVVLIIIVIVTYHVCCLKYVTSIRRNFAKIMQRLSSDNGGSPSSNGGRGRGYAAAPSANCNRGCFQRLRSQFQFSPLVPDDVDNDEPISDEAEFALAVDATTGRQVTNCESAAL